jgi:hypothetical protein
LASKDALQSQTNDLESTVGAGANIVIGHSQGGLIARRLGQQRPDLVSGVISISSPHAGALIANLGPAHVASRLRGAIEGQYCAAGFMCELLNITLRETLRATITYGAFDAVYPVGADNRPGSAFLNNLNSQYEPFQRASIENSVPQRWAIFRLVGDAISSRTNVQYGIRPQGQTWANRADDVYWAGWFLYDLGAQIQYATDPWNQGYSCYGYTYGPSFGTPPCYDQYDTYFGNYYDYAYQSYWDAIADFLMSLGSHITGTMNYIDWTWTDMTTAGGTTDGFIEFWRQDYPNTPGAYVPDSYPIYNGDSHTGETASPFVKDQLFFVLRLWGVQEK